MSTPPPGWPPPEPGDSASPQAYPQGYPQFPAYPAGYQAYPGPVADPLVPTDFASWFQRVFDVTRSRFAPLAIVSALPAVAFGVYLVLISTTSATMAQMPVDPSQDPAVAMQAAMSEAFGRILPILAVFMLVFYVVNALAQAASFQIVIRGANGQATGAGEALRLAMPRVLPYIGWTVLAGLLTTIGFVLLILPGLWLSVVIASSLSGVVLVERAGIGRCFQLIKNRFWATTGRLVIAFLISWVYSFIIGLIAGLATVVSPIAGGVVYTVTIVPVLVYFAAVFVVTYAELRHHENPEVTTATLAAELAR